MVWARLDDEILDNPKIVRAGPLGFALHVAAITWCCRNLTDGFIPRSKVRALLDLSALDVDPANPAAVPDGPRSLAGERGGDGLAIAEHLASPRVKLWEYVFEGEEHVGYRLHDFLEFNPSREAVLAAKVAKSKAGKLGAERRWQNRSGPPSSGMAPPMADQMPSAMAPAMADGWQTDAPDPDPDPDPEDLRPPLAQARLAQARASTSAPARAREAPPEARPQTLLPPPPWPAPEPSDAPPPPTPTDGHASGLHRVAAPPPEPSGTPRRLLTLDEPLTERRRMLAEGKLMNTGETVSVDEVWRRYLLDRIRKETLLGSEATVDADWEFWLGDHLRFTKRDRVRDASRAGPLQGVNPDGTLKKRHWKLGEVIS